MLWDEAVLCGRSRGAVVPTEKYTANPSPITARVNNASLAWNRCLENGPVYGGLRVITTRGTISRRDLLNSYLEVIPFWMHIFLWMGPAVILPQDSKFLPFFLSLQQGKSSWQKEKMHLELNLANFLTNSPKIDGHLETTCSRRLCLHRSGYFFDFFSFLFFYLHKHDWNVMCSWSCLLCYPFQLLVRCLISMGIFCSVSTHIWCDLSATGLGAVWALSVACREDYRLSRSSEAGSGSRPWVPKRDIPLAGGDCW